MEILFFTAVFTLTFFVAYKIGYNKALSDNRDALNYYNRKR